jgi:hypothetical protein
MSETIVDIVVHEFTIGDVEDPVLYAGSPIMEWEKTESGRWVIENCVGTPTWYKRHSVEPYGYRFIIVASMTEQNATYYNLKWK